MTGIDPRVGSSIRTRIPPSVSACIRAGVNTRIYSSVFPCIRACISARITARIATRVRACIYPGVNRAGVDSSIHLGSGGTEIFTAGNGPETGGADEERPHH